MTSHAVKRIQDVNAIRNFQFPQDAGPMAHPIRPDSYMEVNNFYTVTVYNKGAEVIRMLETILGKKVFRRAMDLYFERNDGKAVTTEDFIKAMEDASGLNLKQFRLWYNQAGTPLIEAIGKYDASNQTFTLNIKQSCPPTPGQPNKDPFLIPIRLALLNSKGKELPLKIKNKQAMNEEIECDTSCVISLTQSEETFEFAEIKEQPLPSLLRNFSAPVKLNYPYSDEELIFLMSHDTDGFNSWDAGQQLTVKLIINLVKNSNKEIHLDKAFINAFRTILNNKKLDKLLIAEMLTLPSEPYLVELIKEADIGAIYTIRKAVRTHLAKALYEDFLHHFKENDISEYNLDKKSMGQRRIKNLCLAYLMLLEQQPIIDRAMNQFHLSQNLTDTMGALSPLIHINCPEQEEALNEFYNKWQKETLVVDKWFNLHALSSLPNTLQRVKALMDHPAFDLKNPNKTRALIGVFSQFNYLRFHDISGEGYAFLAEQVLTIDTFNPQLAARLIAPLILWRKYDKQRQALMNNELERIAKVPRLSNDLYEIVTKSLA